MQSPGFPHLLSVTPIALPSSLSESLGILCCFESSGIGSMRMGWGAGERCFYLPPEAHNLRLLQSDRGEIRTDEGLVKGHAYSVTGTHKVRRSIGGLG